MFKSEKYVTGKGFVDVFSSLKSSAAPILKSIGNYVVENKDLIAKPILSAIGCLAAMGLSAGVPTIIAHIAHRNKKNNSANHQKQTVPQEVINEDLEPKYKDILRNINNSRRDDSSSNPLTIIIDSGIKSF